MYQFEGPTGSGADLKSVAFLYFLKHWNIAKAPFCTKTRLNFKSALEFIVSSENFIYDIEIEERSVFHYFIMLDFDIFIKLQHKKQYIMSFYSQCIVGKIQDDDCN